MKNSFCVLLAAVIVASCSSVPENFVKVDGGTFMKGWTEKSVRCIRSIMVKTKTL